MYVHEKIDTCYMLYVQQFDIHCSKYLKEHCVFAIDHNTNALID